MLLNTLPPRSRRHTAVRDLEWVLASPPLLHPLNVGNDSSYSPSPYWWTSEDSQRCYQASLSWLEELDKNPTALNTFLNDTHDHRLGHYFEQLLTFWLIWPDNPFYRLLADHIPIREQGRTLGEIDFIVQDKATAEIQHWEVAVKFYLGLAPSGNHANWYGTNRQDRLDRKVSRLTQHQLVMSQHDTIQTFLQQLGHNPTAIKPVCLLKGRFFYPYRLPKENWTPKYAIPSHSDGWWLSAHDFLEHYATSASRWAVLAKPYWLSELMGSDCVTLFATTLPATEFIQQHVLPDTMCATAIVELSENSEGKITEVSRGFIIPNDWLSALTSQ